MLVAEIQHIKKSFGTNHVINDISFSIEQGENVVLLGKSGSGKSVLIKCLIGLLLPDSGSVTLLGQDVLTLSPFELNVLRKKVGFLFQSAALYDSMTVRQNLEFPLRDNKQLKASTVLAKVKTVLKQVGLLDAMEKMPSELSGGMKKRIGLARTLMLDPEIIFYDEPTTGLDPITSREISELILSVQKEHNTSAIIITHDVECAKITANRLIILNNGKAAAEGSLQKLSVSKDPFIHSFFHSNNQSHGTSNQKHD